MDSGVEMGNDSNDSSITQHENLPVNQISTVNSTVATTTTTTITTSLTTTANCEGGPNTFFIHARSSSLQSPISSCSAIQGSMDTGDNKISVPISAPLQYSYGSFHELQSLPCAYSRSTNVIRCRRIKSFDTSRDRRVRWPYHDKFHKVIKMRLAAETNNTEIMERLLDRGISPNVPDEKGQTPLHIACSQGYAEMVQLLLQHGADPNYPDRAGNTPLHLASLTCCISVVSLLLKSGAEIVSRNGDGFNALQLVQEKLKLFPNLYSDSKVDDIQCVKKQVHDIINLLLTYLQQQKNSQEAVEALSTFYSRLSLSNASNQI